MEEKVKVLITGAKGFMGRNLSARLRYSGYEVLGSDVDTSEKDLEAYCRACSFVFHLAGVNRPLDKKEFITGNCGFLDSTLELLIKHKNKAPVLLSSSIQAQLDNDYGRSKKDAEEILFSYGEKTGAPVYIFRLPNVFGKWSRPNYNSAVATFCHNIARGLPITINDRETQMNLIYIDDVVDCFIAALNGKVKKEGRYCVPEPVYTVKLGHIADLIFSFKVSRADLHVPDMADGLTKKLYATYLSFLPEDSFSYPLKMNTDARGSFTEFIKSNNAGQVSVNITKPGITKGNHWHDTKNEKFLVVSGQGVIRFKQFDTNVITEYNVSGDKLEVLDIPCGYSHNIENTGSADLITIMWASEAFNPDKPDTFSEEVKKNG